MLRVVFYRNADAAEAVASNVVTFPDDLVPFDESTYKSVPEAKVVEQENVVVEPKVDAAETKPDTPTSNVDYNAFVKETFGYDSLEVAKEEFKKLKEQPQQKAELEFANDLSKKLYEAIKDGKEDEIYNVLSQKKQVEKLLNSEVNSELADEILKLSFKSKNSDLNDDEIDFFIKNKYTYPKEPRQGVDETDEEFEERKAEWSSEVEKVMKTKLIDAKMARKEIENLKQTIEFPSFEKPNENQVSQEELDRLDQLAKDYESEVKEKSKSFDGIKVTAKFGEVELPITFTPSDEDKVSLEKNMLDFDLNNFFNGRWLTSEGKVNVPKMMNDFYLLQNSEAAIQKVANEAASKTFEYIKKSYGNISFKEDGIQPVHTQQNSLESAIEKFFG